MLKHLHLFKTLFLLLAVVAGGNAWGQDRTTIYSETFGTPSSNTDVSAFTGFSSSLITPTSTGWRVGTTGACDLTGSSRNGNAYCGSTSDIVFNFGNKLSSYSDVKLSFNYLKGAAKNKANTIKLYFSADGGETYGSDLIPSNTGTSSTWYSVTDITIPAASLANFCMKFSSATNTNRIDDIIITGIAAAPTTCATPTISIPAGAFVSTKNVTIACATADASIYYTTNGDTPTTSSTAYTAPFEISATTTVKAIAVKAGLDNSEVASQTFTKETVINGVAALNAAADGTHYVNLVNAQITFVSGDVAYLNDANAGILVYKGGLNVKTVCNGIFEVAKEMFATYMPEITSISAVEGTTNVAAEVADPVVLTASELQTNFSNYLARQVKINRYVPVSSTEFTDDIKFYTNYQSFTKEADKEYTFVGYPYNKDGEKQFRIVFVEEYLGEPNEITGINDEYRIDLAAVGGIYELDLSGATATSGTAVQFEVTGTNIADGSNYDLSGTKLTVMDYGYITVRAYVNKDATYRAAEKTFTVYLLKQPAIVVNASENITFGSTFTVDDSYIEGGAITVTSANTSVATVDGLVITPKATGSVDITVSTAADDEYVAGSESFTLNINQPAGKETAAPAAASPVTLDFSSNTGWKFPTSKTVTTNTYTNGGHSVVLTGSSSNGYYFFGDYDCLLIGKKGASIGLPSFEDIVSSVVVTGHTNASGSVKMNIYDGETAVSAETTGIKSTQTFNIAEANQGANKSYTLKITSADNAQIKSIQFNFKAVTITATLNSEGYATICSEYPLDFTDYETADYSAWQVTAANEGKMTFSQVTGTVKGGTGLLLKGDANATVTLKSSNSTTTLSGNKLEGTLAPKYITDNQYLGLSGKKFVPVKAGTVKAGKALLPVPGTSTRELTFEFEDAGTTGIKSLTPTLSEGEGAVYDMQGRKVVAPQKGLYIVNGKKVVIK